MLHGGRSIDERKAFFQLFLSLASDSLQEDFVDGVLDVFMESEDSELAASLLTTAATYLKNPLGAAALQLSYDLENDATLKEAFIDTEVDKDSILVYFGRKLNESSMGGVQKKLETIGSVTLLALPNDELFENVKSDLYIFMVSGQQVESVSIPAVDVIDENIFEECPIEDSEVIELFRDAVVEKKTKKTGILWTRAKRSSKVTGMNAPLVRKAMLRAIAQKGYINHNVYNAGGVPSYIKTWEKFVGYGKKKGALKKRK